MDKIGVWSQAGRRVARLDFGGFWWAAVPKSHWPEVSSIRAEIERRWNHEVGDCRQELVFIGIGMDEIEIYDSLQACLLTDEEMSLGIDAWQEMKDSFPPWNIELESVLDAMSQA